MDYRRKATAATLAITLALGFAATALAAHPKPGKRYAGTQTNVNPIVGFSAPVSFKVSSTGKQLLRFTYGTIGCFGAGGFKPGVDPYTRSDLIKVGPITVTGSGHFAISNSKMTYQYPTGGYTQVTKTTISGRFTTRKTATGTITYSQTLTPPSGSGSTCRVTVPRTFTATVS
jgi:hypothetical protein